MVTADVEMAGANEFLQALVQMYLGWARNRGMRIREIDSGASRYDALFKISGFGSFGILQPECGLHVFEIPKGTTSFDRLRARVEVAGVPADTAGMQADRDDRATKVLDESAGKVEIVRRYRRHPSPLVRDSVRQWRSGRLDAVLAGGFDILGSVK
jgi:ATP-dependent Clp protease ATP-binding subunit ClpC